MEYGRLVGDAWRMTWRHRFLWLLGLFAGGASGYSFNSGGGNVNSLIDDAVSGRRGPGGARPSPDALPAEIVRWFGDHLWVVILAVAALLALVLIFFVASFFAQGGLTGATLELADGRDSSLRSALRTGRRLVWRYVGLWLVLVAVGIVVLLAVAAYVGVAVLAVSAVQQPVWVIVPAVLFGIVLALVVGLCLLIFGVVVTFAKRAIAFLDIGPITALGEGWRMLRASPGTSLLVWLLDLVLNIASTVIITFVALALLLLLAIPALIAWFGLGSNGGSALYPLLGYGAVAGLAWVVAIWVLSGVAASFHWSYWTLAFLRLRADAVAAPAADPVA